MTNCYYTSILGNRQDRPVATATTAPDNLGNATTDHGMVDGYKNGFLYNGKYYTPKYGDAVVEYRFDDWNERADVTINGTNNQGTGVNVVGVNITEEVGNIKSVTYNRPFNTAQAATVILPFTYICNGNEGGKFYGFKEVVYVEGLHKWVCTMQEPGNTAETTLTANTPYLFMPDDATTMTFPNIVNMTGGVVTLQPTRRPTTATMNLPRRMKPGNSMARTKGRVGQLPAMTTALQQEVAPRLAARQQLRPGSSSASPLAHSSSPCAAICRTSAHQPRPRHVA